MEGAAVVVQVVIVSGCSGVGKSSVTHEVHHKLRQQKHPHVHIDGDSLDAAYPRPDNHELMLANLKAMWKNSAALKGGHMLIISGTAMVMHHEKIRNVIREVSGCDVAVAAIVLTVSDVTAESRLRQREIGTVLESHLRSSEHMARKLDDFDGIPAHRISTDSRSVEDIADEVIRMIVHPKDA